MLTDSTTIPEAGQIILPTEPDEKPTANLKVLQYSANKLLTLLAPKVTHGTAILKNEPYFIGLQRVKDDRYLGIFQSVYTSPDNPVLYNLSKKRTTGLLHGMNYQYEDNDAQYHGSFGGPARIAANKDRSVNFRWGNSGCFEDLPAWAKQLGEQNPTEGPIIARINEALLKVGTNSQLPKGLSTKPKASNTGGYRTGGLVQVGSKVVSLKGFSPGSGDYENSGFEDFIKIKLKGNGRVVQFKSYLNSFSDSFSAKWSDIQYIGRPDTFKTYGGTTRAVSFGVTIPCFAKADLKANLNKLNWAIGATIIPDMGADYATAPITRLTIGNMLVDTYCVVNSIKVDVDTAETPWDIDEELPHLIKVGFDISILLGNNGKTLDSKTSYFYGDKDNNLGLKTG